MFGSLSDFIDVNVTQIESRFSTHEHQDERLSLVDQVFKKRINSSIRQYQPSDKKHLLARFNTKNQSNRKNVTFLPQTKNYRSQSERKPLYSNTSFFSKSEITKDYISKAQLKRKHNLLRAIVRTNQKDHSIEGVSDYDQSFKRLYDNFKSIYAKPILQARNFVIDDSFNDIPLTPNIPIIQKPANTISNKKRIQYQNCLNWAKKHKKKGEFYEHQLGKHLKQKKQENINQGHSMMPQVQRKLRHLSQTFKTD